MSSNNAKFNEELEKIVEKMMEEEKMIPKKIHYCWFGGNPLPEDIKRYIESWKNIVRITN